MPTGLAQPTPTKIMHNAPNKSKWARGSRVRRPASRAVVSPSRALAQAWAASWAGMAISITTPWHTHTRICCMARLPLNNPFRMILLSFFGLFGAQRLRSRSTKASSSRTASGSSITTDTNSGTE